MTLDEKLQRLRAWLAAAAKIKDPSHELGRRARSVLLESTGLSSAGVELAITRCLETSASEAELLLMCRRVVDAPRVHVILPSNVFVAASRAIALGLCASKKVFVRSSTREPHMAKLLHQASDAAFELVDEVRPEPGDHVWAYGQDDTMSELSRRLGPEVRLHANADGFSAVVLDARTLTSSLDKVCSMIAEETALFDQRGCLSPRLIFTDASGALFRRFSSELDLQLTRLSEEVPLGRLSSQEQAAITWYQRTQAYCGELSLGPAGSVGITTSAERMIVPPLGRHLLIVSLDEPLFTEPGAALSSVLRSFESQLVSLACHERSFASLRQLLPRVRLARIGALQSPPLDGPVDLRSVAG